MPDKQKSRKKSKSRARKKSKSRARKKSKSRSRKKSSKLNTYFDRIFVLNLFDRTDRWKKVSSQFKRRSIDVDRFIAVDGRCKNVTKETCMSKLKTFEMCYNVKIPIGKKQDTKNILPRASLTIGTLIILREMVKRKWKHVLICEDDIILGRDIERKFAQGIKEIGAKKWDILYLGCGGHCGNKDVDWDKTNKLKYLTTWNEEDDSEFYTSHPNDLREPCEDDECVSVSKHISRAINAGGNWCYAYSLSGAKKMIKHIGDNVSRHMDQIIREQQLNNLYCLAFDPPIVWHESLRGGRDTDNPWD
jgi:GR25 family glycosyltransferase involved in LPS biosynthesis